MFCGSRRQRRPALICVSIMLLVTIYLRSSLHLVDTRVWRSNYTPAVREIAENSCPGQTRFLDRPMRLTVLASYPGSGNTWLRYLIEGMAGFATGSNWSDKQLLDKGFIGEFVANESTIVVKTHNNFDPNVKSVVESTKRVILLLRNPYDTLLAEFNRYYMGGDHVKRAYISAFMKHWNKYFSENARKWQPFYSNWLRCENVLPVLYDDLNNDLRLQLQRVLDFLDDGTLTGNIDCALKNSEGYFHRDRSFQPHTNFFYDYQEVNFLNGAIEIMESDMKKRFPEVNFNISSWKITFGS